MGRGKILVCFIIEITLISSVPFSAYLIIVSEQTLLNPHCCQNHNDRFFEKILRLKIPASDFPFQIINSRSE